VLQLEVQSLCFNLVIELVVMYRVCTVHKAKHNYFGSHIRTLLCSLIVALLAIES